MTRIIPFGFSPLEFAMEMTESAEKHPHQIILDRIIYSEFKRLFLGEIGTIIKDLRK